MENSCSKSCNCKLQRLRYFNRRSKVKAFLQGARRNNQRLIPLTTEIQKAMMDFNESQSSTSISEKPICNNVSITRLMRDEVYNILQELLISYNFIRKSDINEIIEKCLKEYCDTKAQYTNDKFEMTVEEMAEDNGDMNKLILKKINILEHRIKILETRLSFMFQNIPKLRYTQAKRFKKNKNVIEELKNEMDKPNVKEKVSLDLDANKKMVYDEIFYTTREYTINLLNYKKSLETLKINEKTKWNPYVKPVNILSLPEVKFKKRSMFLTTNDKNN